MTRTEKDASALTAVAATTIRVILLQPSHRTHPSHLRTGACGGSGVQTLRPSRVASFPHHNFPFKCARILMTRIPNQSE